MMTLWKKIFISITISLCMRFASAAVSDTAVLQQFINDITALKTACGTILTSTTTTALNNNITTLQNLIATLNAQSLGALITATINGLTGQSFDVQVNNLKNLLTSIGTQTPTTTEITKITTAISALFALRPTTTTATLTALSTMLTSLTNYQTFLNTYLATTLIDVTAYPSATSTSNKAIINAEIAAITKLTGINNTITATVGTVTSANITKSSINAVLINTGGIIDIFATDTASTDMYTRLNTAANGIIVNAVTSLVNAAKAVTDPTLLPALNELVSNITTINGKSGLSSTTQSTLATQLATINATIATLTQAQLDSTVAAAITALTGKSFDQQISSLQSLMSTIGTQSVNTTNKTNLTTALGNLFTTRPTNAINTLYDANSITFANGLLTAKISGQPVNDVLATLTTSLNAYNTLLTSLASALTTLGIDRSADKTKITAELATIAKTQVILGTINTALTKALTTLTSANIDAVLINAGGLKDFSLTANSDISTLLNPFINVTVANVIQTLTTKATT